MAEKTSNTLLLYTGLSVVAALVNAVCESYVRWDLSYPYRWLLDAAGYSADFRFLLLFLFVFLQAGIFSGALALVARHTANGERNSKDYPRARGEKPTPQACGEPFPQPYEQGKRSFGRPVG